MADVLRRQKQKHLGIDSDMNHHNHHHIVSPFGFITNTSLSGANEGCKFFAKYETTTVSNFQMCVGQKPVDLKNGMSIINLIQSRGYLPTCRVLHFMLWMQSEVNGKENRRDTFLDIGANIGSCSTHIASLGYPVISAEPVTEHVKTIQGVIIVHLIELCSTYIFLRIPFSNRHNRYESKLPHRSSPDRCEQRGENDQRVVRTRCEELGGFHI